MTPLTRRDVLRSSACAVGVALAGCFEDVSDRSSDDDGVEQPEDAGELGTPAERFTVTTNSDPFPQFDPQVVHLAPGGTVEWVVETGRHDVTAYHEDGHGPHRTPDGVENWGSERISGAGATYERTFDLEGVYDYVDTQQVCTSHEVAGNVGRIVVGWPDPDGEPGMAEPQDELPMRVTRAIDRFNEETRPVLEEGP